MKHVSVILISTLLAFVQGRPSSLQVVQGSRNSRPVPLGDSGEDGSNFENEKQPFLNISVYYETLCPDSLNFLEQQLLPLFSDQKTATFLQVHLVPYGKAVTFSSSPKSSSDELSFLCQHGPVECSGNKLHSCFLHSLQAREKVLTKESVSFLSCTMKAFLSFPDGDRSRNSLEMEDAELAVLGEQVIETCLDEREISQEIVSDTLACFRDEIVSSHLLLENGEETAALQPPLKSLPWLTFNGEFSEEEMDQGLFSLRKVICSHLVMMDNARARESIDCSQYQEEDERRKGRGVGRDRISDLSLGFPEVGINRKTTKGRGSLRKAFLHGNDNLDSGASWRWRTAGLQEQGHEWRWRRPLANYR